jgi:hypothetical protein
MFALGDDPTRDDEVETRAATWREYERLLAARGEKSVPRLTFLDGRLEVRRTSRAHEALRATIDLDQLMSFLDRASTSTAIRDYRAALAATPRA